MTPSTPRVVGTEFLRKDGSGRGKTCVILLNHDLPKCTERLWKQATTRVCADGGASRLRDLGIERCPPPHFIVGDLDSVTGDTLDFYRREGTQVVDLSPDQDTTDLDKCYRVLLERTELWRHNDNDGAEDVLVILGGFGGKWDREMSNLHVMMKYSHLNSILVGDCSLARVLGPGKSEVRVDPEVQGPGCSLIPLGRRCLVTTEGLKWNLSNTPLLFGEMVSTSNVAEASTVVVETDEALIWSSDSNL